ncbi:hypothetical protein ACTFIT_009813 [Dictyostelium discoideum]
MPSINENEDIINKLKMSTITDDIIIQPSIDDLPYEEDVSKNPYSVNCWLRYLEFKQGSPQKQRNYIYERAIRELPRSYKIWHQYLLERTLAIRGKCILENSFEAVNTLFERSLVFLDKMPRIWIEYCEFLMIQEKITLTRKTFDRALIALPVTQHYRIWNEYTKFILKRSIPSLTCIRVYKRYLKIQPEKVEEYIEYLIKIKEWQEVVNQLIKLLDNVKFKSIKGKSRHDHWLQLCEILSSYPKQITGVDVDSVIRSGIGKFSDQIGKLWCYLSDYYIQLAQFEKARDIFEEALTSVGTARDFSFIWESYTQFEDSLIAAKQEILEEDPSEDNLLEFDIIIERYENLIQRQPLLLNSVMLKQNPNNVQEWLKRVNLYSNPTPNVKMIIQTFTDSIKSIDPQLAKGKLSTIYSTFAHFYEQNNKLSQARLIFENSLTVNFKTIDDLSTLYCDYAEMELKHRNYEKAIEILKRGTVSPKKQNTIIEENEPVQKRLFKSIKIWTFYVDLEESFGTFHNTKSIYEKMIQLKVVTPQIILNFAKYLEENKYFEDMFKAYEHGVQLFLFPHVQDIWITYLTKFIQRYAGMKLERTRDLFEQVLSKVPPKESIIFYLMYANFEEQYGLARHSMAVYDRAAKSVDKEDRFKMYLLYIHRASEFFGVNQTREIFSKAIEQLPDQYVRDMCLKFADMEKKYGEIDRARSIYIHGSQFSDPRTSMFYWNTWSDFEKLHGNEDTFKEMLRIRRSVQASYITQNPTLALLNKLNNKDDKDDKNQQQKQQQQQQEKQQQQQQQQQQASTLTKSKPVTVSLPETIQYNKKIENDDEINLDDDEEEEEEEDQLAIKAFPKTLFENNIK